MGVRLEKFTYDDAITRMFVVATVVWGAVAMLVGIVIGLQLASPVFNFETSWLSFGRLRPLHTNAAIFAFAGNALMGGIYFSTQRLLKTRMFSDLLSRPSWSGPSTSLSPWSGSSSRSTSSAPSPGDASGIST
jgi:cytochrome c oxidase cbb3-type subunit I/II